VRQVRTFKTGATRDVDHNKPDYEAYLSPRVLRAYGRYMLKHQIQADGTRREGDNWQKGMPLEAFMKSGWRHFMEWWERHRAPGGQCPPGYCPEGEDMQTLEQAEKIEEALCALLFNVMGYLHETLEYKEEDNG
jgi:hypothetical protein